jgi:hypothetical protein
MTALNRAIELLSTVDARILSGQNGASSGDRGMAVNYHDGQFIMPSEFDEGLTTDWIYAADFAAHSNRVYVGSYSGRVAMLDPDGRACQAYNVGLPPRRIIDTGAFLYILTDPALYALRDGSFERMIDLFDGDELVMAQNGFGLLETKRLRWFNPAGELLGTVLSADPIRRIYQSGDPLVVESRRRRALIKAAPPWWE